jgi:hypothetical protein
MAWRPMPTQLVISTLRDRLSETLAKPRRATIVLAAAMAGSLVAVSIFDDVFR